MDSKNQTQKREIKFRAWDKHKKVFIPTEVWAVVTTDFNAFGVMLKDWENYKEWEYFYSNSQELSQFTGLRDRNGKEIYEGDIVKRRGMDNSFVEYHKGYWALRTDIGNAEWRQEIHNQNLSHVEVIGNIYENPELIN